MDPDRKSTVSSFYGQKNSFDALNPDALAQPAAGRGRDDASSFFNPDRTSMDPLNNRPGNAGYNKGSFLYSGRQEPLKGGRDEENVGDNDAWDVYADFNNAGPRYSTAFGQSPQGYQPIGPSTPKLDITEPTGPVEMITVPAMGAEWGKDELRDMTKAGRREKKVESRKKFWKSWKRDERGLCGRHFTRRTLVFFLFGLCAAIAIVLAFTIPRVPKFAFNNKAPLVNATGDWATAVPFGFSRAPANFSFPAFASLQVDTTSNFLPLKFSHLRAQIFDLTTGRQVASGDLGHKTLPAKSFPDILLPLNFTYIATNTSDQTWSNWYNACNNKTLHQDNKRPPVQFRLLLEMDILGLPTSHSTSTQVSDADCPIELSVLV